MTNDNLVCEETGLDNAPHVRHVPQAVLTIGDCAAQLGVSALVVARAIAKGHLEAARIGERGHWLVTPNALTALVGGGAPDLVCADLDESAGWYLSREDAEPHVAALRQAAADYIDGRFPGQERLVALFDSPARYAEITAGAWSAVEANNPAALLVEDNQQKMVRRGKPQTIKAVF